LHYTEAKCKMPQRASFAWKLKRYLCLEEFKGLKCPRLSFALKLSFIFCQESEYKMP